MLHSLEEEEEAQNIIVRGGRFESESAAQSGNRLEIEGSSNAQEVISRTSEINLIIITFPAFTDGRGFSLAKQLRELGYDKTLRAKGHLLVDQYPLALRCGFDEIEISQNQAARQPEQQWFEVLARVNNNYLDKLMP